MRIKKRTLKIAVILLLFIATAYFIAGKNETTYTQENGLFSYSKNRPSPEASVIYVNTSPEAYSVAEISLRSRDAELSAYVLTPKSNSEAGIVLIPGAGVDKVGELNFAKTLAGKNFTVITYDQRGTGKTVVHEGSQEPEAHKSVYDALAAFDYLRKKMKDGKIILVGESMGGRTAIIAASMDDRIAGVIGISTSGYGPVQGAYYGINPDNYLSAIPPRKLAMIHSTTDPVIPVDAAMETFSIAGQPKQFFQIDKCGHGYCTSMEPTVGDAIGWVLS